MKETPSEFSLRQIFKDAFVPDNNIITKSGIDQEYNWENVPKKDVFMFKAISSTPAILTTALSLLANSRRTEDSYTALNIIGAFVFVIGGVGLSRILYNAVKRSWKEKYQLYITAEGSKS